MGNLSRIRLNQSVRTKVSTRVKIIRGAAVVSIMALLVFLSFFLYNTFVTTIDSRAGVNGKIAGSAKLSVIKNIVLTTTRNMNSVSLLDLGDEPSDSTITPCRINIGSSYLVISGGTATSPLFLTIDNDDPEALTQSPAGHVVSAGKYDKIRWNIGATAGNFEFPYWGSSSYMPLQMDISTAGIGEGNITVSSWYSPGNVEIPDSGYSMCGKESSAIDRFWKVDITGYTTNPKAVIRLFYDVDELDGIQEDILKAQKGDLAISCPWDPPTGSVNTLLKYVEVSSVSSSSVWILSNTYDPLPIELLYFTAKWKDAQNNAVALQWATSSETNNKIFEIQRSVDANNFYTIKTLEGAGNSNQIIVYTTTDSLPYKNIVSYYRLKQVDFNGDFTYSDVQFVNPSNVRSGLDISLYPNPASDHITLMLNSEVETDAVIKIFDGLGATVYNSQEHITTGTFIKQINLDQFNAGAYILQLTTAGNNVTQKQFLVNKGH